MEFRGPRSDGDPAARCERGKREGDEGKEGSEVEREMGQRTRSDPYRKYNDLCRIELVRRRSGKQLRRPEKDVGAHSVHLSSETRRHRRTSSSSSSENRSSESCSSSVEVHSHSCSPSSHPHRSSGRSVGSCESSFGRKSGGRSGGSWGQGGRWRRSGSGSGRRGGCKVKRGAKRSA